MVVLTAVVMASSIEPFTKWFQKYRVNRILAVVLIYLVLALVFTGIFYFFIPSLLSDTANFLSNIPRYIDTISLWNPLSSLNLPASKEAVQSFSSSFSEGNNALSRGFSGASSIGEVFQSFSGALSSFGEGFVGTVSAIFGGLLSLVLIIVLSFYLAVQEDGVAQFLRVITPQKHENYVISLWTRAREKIGKWMQGQLLLAVIIGVLVYLGLTILGVKNALSLAFLAALFETIPLFGPILSAIPGIAIAYSDGGVSFSLLVAGLYLIIHQFENHLIYPLVVKKIIGVPPILVILALIIGYKLAGFLGLLLSVPVATTLMEYFDDLQNSKMAESPTV